jgi:hypothetical protein
MSDAKSITALSDWALTRREELRRAESTPRLRYSVIWLLVVLGIALSGHPWTGAIFGLPWFLHRRWESRRRAR